MKKVPENELFSAYLDGELTAAEQAEVEQLLAASPAARQLMDEFRALSVTLQSLPVRRLGEDLSPRVLHAAERRMLAESEGSDGRQRPLHGSGFSWRAILGRVARPRNLLWPAAAIAAAWLLMTNPELGRKAPPKPGDKQLAVARPQEPPGAVRNPTIGPAPGPEQQGTEVAAAPREGPPAASKVAPKPSAMAASSVSASPAPAAAPKTEEKLTTSPKPESKGPIAAQPAKGRDVDPRPKGSENVPDKATGEVLIVRCDVTEEAIARGLLEKTLARHGLASPRKVPPPQGEVPSGKAARCVEIEATTAQLLAAVADLKAQPDMFRAVLLPAGLSPGGPGERTAKSEGPAKPGGIKMQVRIGAQPMVAKDSGASFPTGAQGIQVSPSTARSIEIRPPAPPPSLEAAKRRVQFVLRIVPASRP